MSGYAGSEAGGFRYIWKIENFSKCALDFGEPLNSPKFTIDELEHTEWHLRLYPRGHCYSKHISCYLFREKVDDGPKIIKVRFTISAITSNGVERGKIIEESFGKGTSHGSGYLLDRKRVFEKKSVYLSSDVLSIFCCIQKLHAECSSNVATVQCTATSRICVERVEFSWNIKNFSSASEFHHPIPYATTTKNPPPIVLKVCFRDKEGYFCIEKTKRKNKSIFICCKLGFADNTQKMYDIAEEEHFLGSLETQWILASSLNKELLNEKRIFVIDDSVSIQCEFLLSVGVVIFAIEEVNILPPPTPELAEGFIPLASDLRRMYADQKNCDVSFQIGTSTTRAHKLILCARSPVFEAMFDSSMKEATSNSIDIEDFDFDTIDRMLAFLYSDSVARDLGFESLLRLYKAADKYQVASLKKKCLALLGPRMCVENFCKVLVIADMHQDKRLKTMVEDFISSNLQDVMKLPTWRELMESDFKLALDTLHQVMSRTSRN